MSLNYAKQLNRLEAEIKQLKTQRDELLEALEEMVSVAEKIDTSENFPSVTLEKALDVIAKAKGEV